MVEINLLPKEFQKKGLGISLDKTFLYVLGGAIVLLLLMVAVTVYQNVQLGNIDDKIAVAQAKADTYKNEIDQINNLNQLKERILSRITSIEKLDKDRVYWVSLFSDLTRRVPSHVWLTDFKQAGADDKSGVSGKSKIVDGTVNKSSVEGYTFSLNALAAFLIQLDKSEYFDNLNMSSVEIEEVEERVMYKFTIACSLTSNMQIQEKKSKKQGKS
ncbi:MAG: hypothetical protein GY855_12660 [candidate division Zixibacteria bacterium]|nr:hypothetical protein [candidate division Zixibacteria bacterium]